MALCICLLPCTSMLMLQRMDGAHEYWNRLKDVTTSTDKIRPVSGHERVIFLPEGFYQETADWSIREWKPGANGDSQAGRVVPSPSGWSLCLTVPQEKRKKGFNNQIQLTAEWRDKCVMKRHASGQARMTSQEGKEKCNARHSTPPPQLRLEQETECSCSSWINAEVVAWVEVPAKTFHIFTVFMALTTKHAQLYSITHEHMLQVNIQQRRKELKGRITDKDSH